MKTIILASVAALAVTATLWDTDPVRSRLDASLGWTHQAGFAVDLRLVLHVGV